MTMMPVEVSSSKGSVSDQMEALNDYVERAATSGMGVHEVELGIWRSLMERTGMRWTVPGAHAMLKLRCVTLLVEKTKE